MDDGLQRGQVRPPPPGVSASIFTPQQQAHSWWPRRMRGGIGWPRDTAQVLLSQPGLGVPGTGASHPPAQVPSVGGNWRPIAQERGLHSRWRGTRPRPTCLPTTGSGGPGGPWTGARILGQAPITSRPRQGRPGARRSRRKRNEQPLGASLELPIWGSGPCRPRSPRAGLRVALVVGLPTCPRPWPFFPGLRVVPSNQRHPAWVSSGTRADQ